MADRQQAARISRRAAKLMAGTSNTLSDYQQSYTRAELEAVRAWLASVAAGGVTTGTTPRPLNLNEKRYLLSAIERLDQILSSLDQSSHQTSLTTTVRLLRRAACKMLSCFHRQLSPP